MATISTKDYLLDQAKRRFTTSPILTVPGMRLLREAAAGPRLAPTRDGRTPCGQRAQTRDG